MLKKIFIVLGIVLLIFFIVEIIRLSQEEVVLEERIEMLEDKG